jgi:hypothetical protein
MYDVFFISYEEPNAEDNWKNLKSKIPQARRIHKISGIANAHYKCAQQSFTKMFYTVDGDTIVDDTWDFSFIPAEWDQQYIHLWLSRNQLNSLIYGYGSVKLWPRDLLSSRKENWLDFTTSFDKIKIVDNVIATTIFNSSPYETWKSTFREVIKLFFNLSKNANDTDSLNRLEGWKNPSKYADFSHWGYKGYQDAEKFCFSSVDHISSINDFAWLKTFFMQQYPDVKV